MASNDVLAKCDSPQLILFILTDFFSVPINCYDCNMQAKIIFLFVLTILKPTLQQHEPH